MAGVPLGVGRSKTDDDVLPDVGFELVRKVGDAVKAGEQVAVVYGRDEGAAQAAAQSVRSAVEIADQAPERLPIIVEELSL
jgi:thymidine phosphorylase